MRLWSLHPEYLDQKGLVACWRESLLAQKVLRGLTRGYTNHPQLARFRRQPDPVAAVGAYLEGLLGESSRRGYKFDAGLVAVRTQPGFPHPAMPVTAGQMELEWRHLLAKLAVRDPERHAALAAGPQGGPARPHPLFTVVPGPVEDWERNT